VLLRGGEVVPFDPPEGSLAELDEDRRLVDGSLDLGEVGPEVTDAGVVAVEAWESPG